VVHAGRWHANQKVLLNLLSSYLSLYAHVSSSLLLLPLLSLLLLPQSPEQASNGAGRLDFCVDSWGLGLLLLALRRAKRPFWWLQVRG
jgi:hypothetical protein